MKIVCISDTHNKHGFIPNLPEGDMIIHAGDISNMGYKYEVENFLYWFNSLNYKYKIFIAGNHDFFFETKDQIDKITVQNILDKYPSIIYLENSGIVIEGINIYGTPIQPTFFNWAFNVDRGKDIKKYWDLIPENTDILIVHGPPYDHGDYIPRSREKVGCVDLINRINVIKPKLVVSGHIHPGNGVTRNEHTTFINASVLNDDYEIYYDPIIYQYK